MPRSLADGKTKVSLFTQKPKDPEAITVTELGQAVDVSGSILKSTFNAGAAGSGTVGEAPLNVVGDPQVFTTSTFTVTMDVFREFDTVTGQVDEEADVAFQAMKEKGTVIWLAVRDQTAKPSTDAWADGDDYSFYELLLDDPQNPTDRGGYIKRTIPNSVQEAFLDRKVVAAG